MNDLVNPHTSHCLSIDVEGFVEGMAESFKIHQRYFDSTTEAREIQANLDYTLQTLDELGVKGTFFILGRIAENQPRLVRQIADQNHEIASHGFHHKRIYGQKPEEFRKEALTSRRLLEDVSGRRVCGFRAPDFSITSETLWETEILLEAGYEYDSSLVPTDVHDVYGRASTKRTIHCLPTGIWEFPLPTFSLLGKQIPFGGGGYLRLYPVFLTRGLLSRYDRSGEPCMLYIHPYELGPEVPQIKGISLYRRFRHYYNCSMDRSRFFKVVKGFTFDTAINIIRAFQDSSNNVSD